MRSLMRLDGVSKIYPRIHQPWERMQAFGSILLGREPATGAEVLSDVSLEVIRGQSLGIIGENGAGKSTLLKILTGVIQPTRGSVEVNTSVAALLELGAGFQPDFSGLDNVRMKASLLGLSSSELAERMDDILSFADIGEYIHEPVKHYSSGMVVRLAFAVVTAARPQVLITDEVLAVGDESFQKKCIRWMENFLSGGGTLLMVSHSMYIVQKLCHKALWLSDGKVQQYGEAFPVTQSYLAWHESRSVEEKVQRDTRLGDGGRYQLKELGFPELSGNQDSMVNMGDDLLVETIIYSPDLRSPVVHIGIIRIDGTPVYGVTSDMEGVKPVQIDENHFRFRIRFIAPQLLPGSYHLRALAMDPEGLRVFDELERVFQVNGKSIEVGIVQMPHEWVE
ncbi:MAG: lipopolysaccharide transport system ATP-binding protein [Lysobacterales bacterium]|jgi:lipopolysaccharide transport system ATP-binding protein